MTTERDPMAEFHADAAPDPTPTTEAMQNGIDFEDMVTDIINGRADPNDQWYAAAEKVARRCAGGVLQYKAKKDHRGRRREPASVWPSGLPESREIIDIKFTKSYDTGKFFSSTAPHLLRAYSRSAAVYLSRQQRGAVWPETYRREEAPSIFPVISDFFDWLRAVDLMQVYQEKWATL